jgi:hypothetical protein
MKGNSKRPKGVVMAVLGISAGCTRIWLFSDKIDFREDATTRKLMGIVMDMTDGVAVGDGT